LSIVQTNNVVHPQEQPWEWNNLVSRMLQIMKMECKNGMDQPVKLNMIKKYVQQVDFYFLFKFWNNNKIIWGDIMYQTNKDYISTFQVQFGNYNPLQVYDPGTRPIAMYSKSRGNNQEYQF